MGQRGHDRDRQQRLRQHHGRRREQQVEHPERPDARQQQIEGQPHNDRRQAEQRVGPEDDGTPPTKPQHRQRGAQRQPDHGGDGGGREAHEQREPGDLQQFAIALADQHDRAAQRGREVGQGFVIY